LLNEQTFDVCCSIIGTLTELIQGPCKANQKVLVNAKIIDSAREYIAGFSTLDDVHHLGFEDEDAMDQIG
jgi:hypothetical protein